jgi:hypothetical protein
MIKEKYNKNEITVKNKFFWNMKIKNTLKGFN